LECLKCDSDDFSMSRVMSYNNLSFDCVS